MFCANGASKMRVHAARASQKSSNAARPDGQHHRQANRRPHRITAAHPIPKFKHIGRIPDAKARTRSVWLEIALVPRHHASAGAAASNQARAASAFISVSGVVNDLEATINQVVWLSPSSLRQVLAVQIGDKAHVQLRRAAEAECAAGQQGPRSSFR